MATTAPEDVRAWTEVFTQFQRNGQEDRGAAFAMTVGSLRRRREQLELRIEAAEFKEKRLLSFAHHELDITSEDDASALKSSSTSSSAAAAAVASTRAKEAPEISRSWGRALAERLGAEVAKSRAMDRLAAVPWKAAIMADDAHGDAVERLEREQKEREQVDLTTRAVAKAQAQAVAEVDERIDREVSEKTRTALASRGLNSKRLPLRPGFPPCGYFMRKGTCRRGRACMWDHPEPSLNSLGYPSRPGQTCCATFRRTQTCKFGVLCTYDHPEPEKDASTPMPSSSRLPPVLAKMVAQQHQLQLLLHLQLLQEMDMLQDPEAMMTAWVKFRLTFSHNSG